MNGYAIWTFDLVAKFVTDKATGKVVKVTAPDAVLWQDCPPDWGYTKAIGRARILEARNAPSVFVVRRLNDDGQWSDIPALDCVRGCQSVRAKQGEQNAVEHQKRLARKIRTKTPYVPEGGA